jgi:hypothetical protein
MRRLLIIAMATALFVSVAVGIAEAETSWEEDAWFGSAEGHMVAADAGHRGLTIDLTIKTKPKELNWTGAHGRGYYEYEGNAFRLRVTHACVIRPEDHTLTVWGPARVTSGSFDDGALVKGDKGYAVLSLIDEGNGIVSARAGMFDVRPPVPPNEDDPYDPVFTMIAQQCEAPAAGSAFPATGPGTLEFTAR